MDDAAYVREAVRIAQQILADEIAPYDGAAAIWRLYSERGDSYPDYIAPWIGLASEWQDHPELRASHEADIRRSSADTCVPLFRQTLLGGFGETLLVAGVRWSFRGKDAGSVRSE